MSDPQWLDWSKYHCTVFRWTGEEDFKMLETWRPAFEAKSCTHAELRAASLELVQREPKWRTEHLNALLTHIASARMRHMQARRAIEEQQVSSTCKLCRHTGIVSVPHLRRVEDNEWVWPFYLCGVACRCHIGVQVATDHASKCARWHSLPEAKRGKNPPPRMMGLDEYEMRNPDWERQVMARAEQRETEQVARSAAEHGDKTRGPLKGIVGKLLNHDWSGGDC